MHYEWVDAKGSYRKHLFESLRLLFSIEDLRQLCFALNIDYESLSGDTKEAKARALVQFCENRGKLGDLYDAIREARPNLRSDENYSDVENLLKSIKRSQRQSVSSRNLFVALVAMVFIAIATAIYVVANPKVLCLVITSCP
jgi:integrase